MKPELDSRSVGLRIEHLVKGSGKAGMLEKPEVPAFGDWHGTAPVGFAFHQKAVS